MQLCLEKPQIVSLTLFSHFSSLLLSFTLPGSERAYYTTHAADGAHLTSHKHSHTHAHTLHHHRTYTHRWGMQGQSMDQGKGCDYECV